MMIEQISSSKRDMVGLSNLWDTRVEQTRDKDQGVVCSMCLKRGHIVYQCKFKKTANKLIKEGVVNTY